MSSVDRSHTRGGRMQADTAAGAWRGRAGALDAWGAAPVDVAAPRLVCLTHREPFSHGADGVLERTTGGVVTALDATLRELGGAWIATGERSHTGAAPVDAGGRSYDVQQ